MRKRKRKVEVLIPVNWGMIDRRRKLIVPNEGVDPGSIVIWSWKESRKDPFFILFPDASPFRSRELQSKNGLIKAEIIYDPRVGGARRFKYIIAGFDGTAMHILDPDIIIPREI